MHTIIDGDGRYCRAGDIQTDPLARLEAWRAAGQFREWKIHKHRDGGIDVMLGDHRRSLGACEATLSDSVEAALAAWEGT